MSSADSTIPRASLAAALGKRTDFESPAQEAYLNLLRTHVDLTSAFDRLFKSHGISQPLYNILRILRGHRLHDEELAREHRGLPIQRIGSMMVTREPDMTRLIDRLEKVGFVERHRCSEDRRVVYVKITDSGLELAERLMPAIATLHAEQLGHMTPDRLRMLSDLLGEARQENGGASAAEA